MNDEIDRAAKDAPPASDAALRAASEPSVDGLLDRQLEILRGDGDPPTLDEVRLTQRLAREMSEMSSEDVRRLMLAKRSCAAEIDDEDHVSDVHEAPLVAGGPDTVKIALVVGACVVLGVLVVALCWAAQHYRGHS